MEIQSTCQICGSPYTKRNGKSKYCSDVCKKEATKQRYTRNREKRIAQTREWRKNHPNYDQAWREKHPNYARDRHRKIRGSKVEKRACIICGKEFETARPHKLTCSDECKKERKKRYAQERGTRRPAGGYHDAYIKRRYGSEENRQKHLEKTIRTGKCIVCGAEYQTRNPAQKTCSKKCGKRLHYSRKTQRIPKNQIIDKDITLEALFRRDSGVCYLCGKPCDWNDKQENIVGPNYPSIDHVVPVSQGGLHSWSNVKLAHFACNAIKSDSMDYEAEGQCLNNYKPKLKTNSGAKAVLQYTRNGMLVQRFQSATEAERVTGIYRKGIQRCARGECAICKGYVWKYEA